MSTSWRNRAAPLGAHDGFTSIANTPLVVVTSTMNMSAVGGASMVDASGVASDPSHPMARSPMSPTRMTALRAGGITGAALPPSRPSSQRTEGL